MTKLNKPTNASFPKRTVLVFVSGVSYNKYSEKAPLYYFCRCRFYQY